MKFQEQEALDIINKREGYRVVFQVREGDGFRIDHFPDKKAEEPLIPTYKEAWDMAQRFAKATGPEVVNIFVVEDTFCPAKGYDVEILKLY
jgi:hypothetical protein